MPANLLKKWNTMLMAKLTLDIAKEIVRNKEGECLSTEYINRRMEV